MNETWIAACGVLMLGFTLANLVILGLNLKLYTEFAKEKFKSGR